MHERLLALLSWLHIYFIFVLKNWAPIPFNRRGSGSASDLHSLEEPPSQSFGCFDYMYFYCWCCSASKILWVLLFTQWYRSYSINAPKLASANSWMKFGFAYLNFPPWFGLTNVNFAFLATPQKSVDCYNDAILVSMHLAYYSIFNSAWIFYMRKSLTRISNDKRKMILTSLMDVILFSLLHILLFFFSISFAFVRFLLCNTEWSFEWSVCMHVCKYIYYYISIL